MTGSRLLCWTDALWCYRLARDPEVRKWSLDPKPPTLWGHVRWMWEWVRSERRTAMVFERTGERVGLLRLIKWGNGWLVSIAVHPDHRGRGNATWMLDSIPSRMHTLYADIHENNLVSHRLFRTAGFEKQGQTGEWHHYRRQSEVVWAA